LILHADNTRPHTAKSNLEFRPKRDLKAAPHPPYSLDLELSDSFRFDDIKDKLKGLSLPSALHPHHAMKQMVRAVRESILMATFDQWIARVERCIQLDGGCFE
jgi:hypothetical protein